MIISAGETAIAIRLRLWITGRGHTLDFNQAADWRIELNAHVGFA